MNVEKPKSPPPYQLALKFLKDEALTYDLLCWQGEFYLFSGGKYRQIETGDFKAKVMTYLQTGVASIEQNKIVGSTLSDVLVNLDALCRVPGIKKIPTWLGYKNHDANDFICLKDSLFNLKKFLSKDKEFLEEHTSDFFTTNQCSFSYKENAEAPVWKKFLAEMLPDESDHDLLQEWFGYNLIPDTSFQKCMIMYGEGANGKSVACTVLQALLGVDCVSSINIEGFDARRTFLLAETAGKLANIVSEINTFDKTAVGELKKYIASDITTAERKFKTPFSFYPTARLTFASNVLPRFSDPTDGIWRRLLLINFKVQILDEEKQDKNLTDIQWWEKSSELPGIFNWALEGLERLRKNGKFTQSEEMLARKEQLKLDSNPAKTFLKDFCVESNIDGISSHYLYREYREEMVRLGFRPLHINQFAEEVRRTFDGALLTPNVCKRPDCEMTEEGPRRSRLWIGIRKRND